MNRKKRTAYNKLVRDRIPEIIKKRGGRPEIKEIDNDYDYSEMLAKKLEEEVQEFLKAHRDWDEEKIPEELADILEVIDALLGSRRVGVTKKELLALKAKKAREKGGFKKGIILIKA